MRSRQVSSPRQEEEEGPEGGVEAAVKPGEDLADEQELGPGASSNGKIYKFNFI